VPGGIDAHVHFDMEFLGQSKHSFESGTIAAAFGGTTTVIDFTLDLKTLGGPLLDAVENRREKAEGKAVIDFAFHCSSSRSVSSSPLLTTLLVSMPEVFRDFSATGSSSSGSC